jgi:hypothetical protein
MRKKAQQIPPMGGLGIPPNMGMMGPGMGPNQAPPPTPEQQIMDIIQQKINNEYPYMLKYLKNINMIDKKEDSLSYVFGAEMETPYGEFVAPIFVVNGLIKPISLLFDKQNGIFIPNSEQWIKMTDSIMSPQIGEQTKVPKDLKTDVDVRNLVIPPTTGRYSYASDPDFVITKIASLSNEQKKELINFFKENKDLLKKAAEFWGVESIKIALSPKPEGKPDNKPFEIITSLDDKRAKNKFYFNSIVNKGYVIEDKRPQQELNKTIVIEEPAYYFQINAPGFYRVWTTDGIKDVLVAINIKDLAVYGDRPTSLLNPNLGEYTRENVLENELVPTGGKRFMPIRGNYIIIDSNGKFMVQDNDRREVYTALKILDPQNIDHKLFREILDNIHNTNINEIRVSDSQKDKTRPLPASTPQKAFIFLSIKPNGSISAIEVSNIDGVFKDGDTIIITVDKLSWRGPGDGVTKLIYDPDISGQDFKIVSNGHESVIILPYNVKYIKAQEADYDILDASNITNDPFAEAQKTASDIVDIALRFNIPISDAENIKIASEQLLDDIYIVTNEINNILYKFAEAISEDSGGSILANFILQMPDMMSKVGQALGRAMAGGQLPPGMPPLPPDMLPPPGAQPVAGQSPQDQVAMDQQVPSTEMMIDQYIDDLSKKLKELSDRAEGLKQTLSILSEIKAQSGGQPTPSQQEVADLMRDAGDLSQEAFNAATLLGMADEPDFEKNIMVYMPHILKGIDSIGRIISELNFHSTEIANKYGEKFKNAIEDKANRVFKQLGDFYLFVKGAKITGNGRSKE